MAVPPTDPGWATGYVPSALEWQTAFQAKADFPVSIDQGGTGAQSSFSACYNLFQRATLTATATVAALGDYSVQSHIGPITVDLPPLASLNNGDWIRVFDVDNDAATNNITIQANGADTIDLNGAVAGSQVLTTNGSYAMLVVNSGVWGMVVFSTSAGTVVPGPVTTSGLTESTATMLGRTTAATGPIEEIAVGAGLTLSAGSLVADANLNRSYSFSILGSALASSEIAGAVAPPTGETWTFPTNFANSVGYALSGATNPAASYNIDVQKNGVSVGTITISAAGAVSFATSGGTPFTVVGGTECLTFVGNATADTAVGFTFTMVATY